MERLNLLFDRIIGAFAALAAAIFGATAVLIAINVVLRNTSHSTIFGLLDAVEYGMLAATFFAAPWVLAKHAHVTVDLVTAGLPSAAARPIARAIALLGFAVSAIFLRYATEAALVSAERSSMIRTAFVIPEWWVLAIAPVSFVLICIEFLRQAARPADPKREASGL